ncbi:hypothetical protein N3K66_001361 [Trichothecium roseum]|uniref:Uncharacterized protein n=1 Tax=Trichothecium roseum TaxID=47278 RepID=A0ACC0VEM9_9HYPO|nr:hypothetical protein N3K66_001361 [Trichothecium roseum]
MEGQYPPHIAIVGLYWCAACQVMLQEPTQDGLCSCRQPLQPVCILEQDEGAPDVHATQWPIHHGTLADQGDEIALEQPFAPIDPLDEWVSVNWDAGTISGTISDPSVATPDQDASTIDGVEAIADEETYYPRQLLAGDQQYYTDDEKFEFSPDEDLRSIGAQWSQ